jgi:hypothetical protein
MIAPIKGSFLFEEFDDTGIVTGTHIQRTTDVKIEVF